jgi:hypothetical protein
MAAIVIGAGTFVVRDNVIETLRSYRRKFRLETITSIDQMRLVYAQIVAQSIDRCVLTIAAQHA